MPTRRRILSSPDVAWCGTCEKELPKENFGLDKRRNQPRFRCRSCENQKSRIYAEANREKVRAANRKNHIPYTYGISVEEHEYLVIRAGGHCEACGAKTDDLVLDHDHACCSGRRACGKCVRGFLCRPCNLALGYVNDSITRLDLLVNYIRSH